MELVVYANILVSGLLKDGITRELMLNNYISLYTSELIFEEFFEHIGELAKKENKPIFLSIGYSKCHWCHVIAHESFEDKEVAQQLSMDNHQFLN